MRKVLIRAGMSPLINTPVEDVIFENKIGNNVGNLVYAYSIFRTLMTDDTEIIPNNYYVASLDPNEINETYDCFVIPLADAIRNSFAPYMVRLTALIKQLKIPCYVVGMGVRAPYHYETKGISFEYDEIAKNFIKAVLEKSAMLGLRGEITADYLKKLGFLPEIDYTVIGCPSFYGYGENLNIRPFTLNENTKLAVNNTVMTGGNTQKFLNQLLQLYPDHYFYPQRINELALLYLGHHYKYKRKSEGYPNNLDHPLYKQDRVRFFTNAMAWMQDLSERDLSVGPRLHGNVAAVLAGTPALWIMHDARMRELVDYHNLPNLNVQDIKEGMDINELLSNIRYSSFLDGHRERFVHYVDFLNKNGIPHIFKDYKSPEKTVLDEKIEKFVVNKEDYLVKSILGCDLNEILRRTNAYVDFQDSKADLSEKEGYTEEFQSEAQMFRDELKATKEELKEVSNELREAKRGLWYMTKRKIRNLINKRKNTDQEAN